MATISSIRTSGNRVEIIDQLLLPRTQEWIEIDTIEKAYEAIKSMKIRGAPAIGSLAALSVASHISASLTQGLRPDFLSSSLEFSDHIKPLLDHLFLARLTAVNLGAALDQIRNVLDAGVESNSPVEEIAREVIKAGRAVHEIDLGQNRAMGKWGGDWIVEAVKKSGGSGEELNLMTVCNAGSLATSGYGTALGVITYLFEIRKLNKAYFIQSRPYHQGSRLTALEPMALDIPSVMVCDSMVGSLFQHHKIDAIVVGADSVVKNRDTANKIGTYNAAVLAARHKIPFLVIAPTSTIDLNTVDGSGIPVEHRPPIEARLVRGALYPATPDANGKYPQATVMVMPLEMKPEGVYNPSFDVTPAELITAIVTEKGVAVKENGVFDLENVL
ncbi:eukaryotic translation initiation factor 2B [Thelephora terrestris]|uniref:Methylthioribose-1-phosphate isomerase n=1 Tax=Thelephora terrestris TaxID=56493 RepID=A0A9P6HTX5_9AGAM|nr:eukaryotic translation initiation factor 2B [Thelephora terrestris]